MSTIRDAMNVYDAVVETTSLIGATAEFLEEFHQQCVLFVEAFSEDFGKTVEEAINTLSPNTPLGVRAEHCLAILKKWLHPWIVL